MTLKSLSTKLYLGIAAAALIAWAVGVPGRTIVSFAAVAFMLAMHAGGHGGHGGGPNGGDGGRGQADPHAGHTKAGATGHTGHTGAESPKVAADEVRTSRTGSGGGCH